MGSSLTKTAPPESSVDRLSALSKAIQEKTKILTEALRSRGLEAPSFQAGGLSDFPVIDDKAANNVRREIVLLTKELHDLVVGPRETLKNLAWDSVSFIPLQAITEFRIAEAVPRQGSISYEDLSIEVQRLAGTAVAPSDLRRLLRLAMTDHIFQEPEIGYVAHNRTSLLMLEDENLASWVGMYTIDLLAPVASTVAAMRMWPESEEDNQTGVNIAFNHKAPFFDHLKADAARAKRYNLAMRAQSSREAFDPIHIVRGYPWASLGKGGKVIDMGGNEGFVSVAIAEAFPQLDFEVQDLPFTRTPAILAKIPKHLQARVKLTSHDFFNPQLVSADAYLFRHVFHAFSDKYAVNILRALIPALKPGARIIINDLVLPAPGEFPRVEEKPIRTMDVLMKTVCNSKERELGDWKALFKQADERFQWKGAWKTEGKLWIIESIWEP